MSLATGGTESSRCWWLVVTGCCCCCWEGFGLCVCWASMKSSHLRVMCLKCSGCEFAWVKVGACKSPCVVFPACWSVGELEQNWSGSGEKGEGWELLTDCLPLWNRDNRTNSNYANVIWAKDSGCRPRESTTGRKYCWKVLSFIR